jgi:hypothetical protein
MNVAAAQGSLVVTVNTAAGDYDDIALCDSIMNEQGVQAFDRYLALSSRDYNGMAGNIAGGTAGAANSRSFSGNKSNNAFERSYVGMVAGFDTYKLDYANRLAAATGADPTMSTLAAAANLIREKKVKALAVTTKVRSGLLPELPTMQDAGIEPFDIGTWFGVFTTAGTPAAVVDKLHTAYMAALAEPEVKERLKTMGSEAASLSIAQMTAFVATERAKYQELVKLSGATNQ